MGKIIVAGLGPGGIDHLPTGTYRILKDKPKLYLRTAKHPITEDFIKEKIQFESFDYLYEQCETFEEVYQSIVEVLLEKAEREKEIVYGVPGHPMVAEKTVEMLLNNKNSSITVEILPAVSCLEAVYAALKIDPTHGLTVVDCLELIDRKIDPSLPLLCVQLYNRRIASDVKLRLIEDYPEEHVIKVVHNAGIAGKERIDKIPLYELDRLRDIDHLTSLYVPALDDDHSSKNLNTSFEGLVEILARLRGPDGCPWDKQQTHESLKRYLIEETYEVIEAIEENDVNKLKEELGDLLLQIVFHARVAEEQGKFNIFEVIEEIKEKLIRRHPHVFGNQVVKDASEVNINWEKIKRKEKRDGPFLDVPRSLPALLRAEKIQKKAAEVGFDWPDIKGVWDKIDEELGELKSAVSMGSFEQQVSELGDLLFSVVNLSRFLKIDPEEALSRTINKFIKRFNYVEKRLKEEGKKPEGTSLEKMDELWDESKKKI
ncbi:MAG TPA: nucleoside triphosphate pyrophosphohydrolase [Peptococcaceae bacterium]|nr:nucleoside triphosphate pyrophosphohydrolase [Peptococcaceae bacterium]